MRMRNPPHPGKIIKALCLEPLGLGWATPRNVRRTLKLALTDTPVVALLGPRQSGKSTLVRTLAPDRAYVTLDEEPTLRTAREDPVGFIAALPARVTLDEA